MRSIAHTVSLLAVVSVAATCTAVAASGSHGSALEALAAGNVTSAIQQVVPGFEWAWLERDPRTSLHVEDPTLDFLIGDYYDRTTDPEIRSFMEFAAFKNSLVVPSFIEKALPHFFVSWLRNYVFGMIVYYMTGLLWCAAIYGPFRSCTMKEKDVPTTYALFEQMSVSTNAMYLYTWLPTWSEWLVERGYSLAYDKLDSVTPVQYFGYFLLYMLGVEFGIYWAHRLLHDIKPLYRLLHCVHHKYNKGATLSPFAGLAFHPVDGCIQAFPYVIMMFVVPMHFLSHEILLFFTAVWTTNIHDTVQQDSEPVMGAAYHEIHHVDYKHNYGQYTILFDWLYGTLKTPKGSKWDNWESTAGEVKSAGRTQWDRDMPELEKKSQ